MYAPAENRSCGYGKTATDKMPEMKNMVRTLPAADREKYRKRIEQLKEENKFVLLRNNQLYRENKQLKRSSDEITRKMADILDTKGELENLADDFGHMKLASIFKSLYDNNWTSLLEWLQCTINVEERDMITLISKLMKECYKRCVFCADRQIREFVLLSYGESVIPTESEDPALYKIRRKYGQTEKIRAYIRDRAVKVLQRKENENSLFSSNETISKLESFLKEYIECCWLMTISNPSLVLNFDVIGKPHRSRLLNIYKKFSSQDIVVDRRQVGTIVEVVWPAVTTKDGASIYITGDVITVDKVGTNITNAN